MKKMISLLMALSFIPAMIPSALAATVTVNAKLNRSSMTLNVSGKCSDRRNLTFYVSDDNIPSSQVTTDDLYAMQQLKTADDGSFDIDIKLPEDISYGEYKVVVGGLGTDVDEAQRSASFSYESLENFSLWLEAETDAELFGNYKKITGLTDASAGGRIVVDTTDTETENKALFNFEIPTDGNFDIWVLSTLGGASYVTSYLYSIDGSEEEKNNNAPLEKVYNTTDLRKVPVYWTKLTETDLKEGNHTLSFSANEYSELNSFIYHSLDAVVIVPNEWNWQPAKYHKTYNASTVKLECTNVKSYTARAKRGGSVEATVTTKLNEETVHDATVWAAVVKNGELVSSTVKDTQTPTSKAVVGREYQTKIVVNIPSFAPDGDYDIICGIGGVMKYGFNFANGVELTEDGFVKAGSFTIGSNAVPEPESVGFEYVNLETNKESIVATYKLSSSNAQTNEKAFVKLWKDDVLWGVAESSEISETSDTASEHSAELILPEGIPSGSYRAEFGFYNINRTENCGAVNTTFNGKYGYKPLSNGIYKAQKTGRNHFWYVNQENALIWDGEPYIPIGGMECLSIATSYSGDLSDNENSWQIDKAELETLIRNGVTDLYINAVGTANSTPGWVWEYIFSLLEENGVRYSIQTNGAVNNTTNAFYIRANKPITVSDVTSSGIVETTAPIDTYGAIYSATGYYALIDSSDTAVKTGKCTAVRTDDGYKFSADIILPSSGTYKVVFTPKVYQNNTLMANFWDYYDENIDYAERFGNEVPMGDNFRCIIDPLTNEAGYYNCVESIRPYSESYNRLYAKWLSEQYSSVRELMTSWKTSGISSFDEASALIPLYTEQSNSSDYNIYAVNPETNKIYTLKGRSGIMWTDYLRFRDESTANFYNDVSDAYKKTADVPLVIKNVWGHKEYFINKNQKGGFDGLGAEAYGSSERLKHLSASCYGMGQQFGKTAWLIATETETEEDIAKKYNEHDYGYGTEANMHEHFNALMDYGLKGIFDFVYSARHDGKIQTAYSYIENSEMFEWANNYRAALDINSRVKYVPREHKVYMLPHNSNFYTNPNRYTAVIKNDDYDAVIQPCVSGNMLLLPIENANTDGEVIAATFKNGPASTAQGKIFGNMLENMPPERQAVYLGHRYDLGTVGQLDRYFTSNYDYNSDGIKVQILKPTATSEIIRTTPSGNPWVIRDGNLWIISAENTIESQGVKYLEEIVFADNSEFVWRDKSVRKSDGTEPLSLEAGEYVIKAQVINNSGKTAEGAIISATYSGGKLTGVSMNEKKLYTGLNELGVTITATENDTVLKSFIWDSASGMKPINYIEPLKK